MKPWEYDQAIRRIALRGDISYPWDFTNRVRRLCRCLSEVQCINSTKSEENVQTETISVMLTDSYLYVKPEVNRSWYRTETFLLKNPDGSGCGIGYNLKSRRIFETFPVKHIAFYKESIIMTSGIWKVVKNIQ